MKVTFRKSTNPQKKYMATFYSDKNKKKKIKTVHFGSNGMSDYTKHKDKSRKKIRAFFSHIYNPRHDDGFGSVSGLKCPAP